MNARALIRGVGVVAGALARHWLLAGTLVPGVRISAYFLQVMRLAGINIILAVSLNLINGFTGQFSIGHAGFMAVGAYASAYVAVTFGRADPGGLSLASRGRRATARLLLAGLAGRRGARGGGRASWWGCRRCGCAATTWPSSRSASGRSSASSSRTSTPSAAPADSPGIPKLANFFWVYLFAASRSSSCPRIVRSSHGRALLADPRGRGRGGGDGGRHDAATRSAPSSSRSAFAGIAGGLFGHYLMYLHTEHLHAS